MRWRSTLSLHAHPPISGRPCPTQAQTKAEGLGAELRVGEERRALAEARCVERGRVLEATQRDLQRLVLKVNKTIKTAAHVYHAQVRAPCNSDGLGSAGED